MKARHTSSGFTLLEALGAIFVFTLLSVAAAQLGQWAFRNLNQSQAAQHLQTIHEGVNRYVKQNYHQLLTQATPNSGPELTVEQLMDENLLPEGFSDENVWGQSYAIHIRKPHGDILHSVILTVGGIEHEDDDFASLVVPGAAMRLGAAGGFIPTGALAGQSAGTLHGIAGGYVLDLAALGIASPGPGHLGMYSAFDAQSLGTEYLYRESVPGHPEYNSLEVELDMTGHGITEVASVQYVSRTVQAGETCTAANEGKLFLDKTQGLYICRNSQLALVSDSKNSMPMKNATIATHGQKITKPSCGTATGLSPHIYVAPVMAATGASSPPLAAMQAWATSVSDTQWQVHLRVMNTQDGTWTYPAANYGKVMVFATCQ